MARWSVRLLVAVGFILVALGQAPVADAAALDDLPPVRQGIQDAIGPAAPRATTRPAQAPASPGALTPNQLFAGRSLAPSEAAAACGPAAAVAFSRAVGKGLSLDAAVSHARAVGWTPTFGMAGPWSQLALLQRLGIPATLQAGVDRQQVARETQAGRPVIVRTAGQGPGHYFVAERFDAASGRFDFGQSALVLKSAGGQRWFRLDELSRLGVGRPTHAIYLKSKSAGPVLAAASVKTSPIRSGSANAVPAGPNARTVDAGGAGANLRAAPGTASRIVSVVADGSRLTDLGSTVVVAGRTWKQVRAGSGTVAWIDAGLLRPA